MKGLIASLLLINAAAIHAAEQDRSTLGNGIHQLNNAFLCQAFKGDRTSFGKGMQTRCANQAAAEFVALPELRSLKDCIKPGNVIDEDVRKCMKGL
jgi:hypothetical protein